MSQEELHQILNRLSNTDTVTESLLLTLKQLEREHYTLQTQVSKSLQRKKDYEEAKQLLSQLLEKHRFNEIILNLPYPSKLLNGPIQLDNNGQQNAINELSITLSKDPSLPKSLIDITAALKIFYNTYFDKQGKAPDIEEGIQKKLEDFEQNPEKGSLEAYQQYRSYSATLFDADQNNNIELIDQNNIPNFAPSLHAEMLFQTQNLELKLHLLQNTEWTEGERVQLESLFETEDDLELQEEILEALKQYCGLDASFLNKQIQKSEDVNLFVDVLKDYDDESLNELIIESINQNYQDLLELLINMIGFNQHAFYHSLANGSVQRDVFKTMIDSLFHSSSPRGTYGMDSTYAEKVIGKQRKIPSNVVKTLQKALPRGFEGSPLAGYFHFLNMFNQQIEKLKLESHEFSEKNKLYCEHQLKLSDTEAIRFIMFTYIFDVLKKGIFPSKLGMSRSNIIEKIQNQHQFELTVGKNQNILGSIRNLFTLYPDFTEEAQVS